METFNEHFVSIGERLAAEIPPSVDSSLHYLSKTKKAEANFHFVKLKTGKTTGMDLMSDKFLKIAKNIFKVSL